MLEILKQIEALNAEIVIERDNSDWRTADPWSCRVRGKKDGSYIECFEQAIDPETAVGTAWRKFESIIRGGIPEMRDQLALPHQR